MNDCVTIDRRPMIPQIHGYVVTQQADVFSDGTEAYSDNAVAVARKFPHQVRAYETGDACDRYLHAVRRLIVGDTQARLSMFTLVVPTPGRAEPCGEPTRENRPLASNQEPSPL